MPARIRGWLVGGVSFIVAALLAVAAVVVVPMLRPASRAPKAPDPLASAVLEVLPGGNCGACGNDSCFNAAVEVAAGRAPSGVCAAGGPETAAGVERVLRAHGRA